MNDAASTRPVLLEGVPAVTLRYAQEQHDALLRELELLTLGAAPDDTRVDDTRAGDTRADGTEPELSVLGADLADLKDLFQTFRPMITRQTDPDDASSTIYDLTMEVPPAMADRADRGNELFDRLEALCGGLLLLAPPPALASGLRRWVLLQVAGQLRGADPEPWPAWWEAHGGGSPAVPVAPDLR